MEDDRCCCNLLSIKVASYLVSTIFAFFIVSNFLVKIAGYSDLEWNWELVFLVSDSIAVACLFYGTYIESAAYFQPFVVLSVCFISFSTSCKNKFQIITVSFLVLLLGYTGAAVYDPHSYPGEYLELLLHEHLSAASQKFKMKLKDGNFMIPISVVSLFASIASVVIILALICHSLFLVVAIRCAKHFRQKSLQKIQPESIVISREIKEEPMLFAEPLHSSVNEAYTESPLERIYDQR
ncbi:hypothetical protein FO519_002653 [Halicephalobus sp. NKZ332]|nr:hypothetical protein FO519_002653 [Halicephalobus sp. NKZ332]